MKFKAILINALIPPFGNPSGTPGPWQVFAKTQEEAEDLGKQILEKLSEGQRKEAYVKVSEVRDVAICEIHTAVEKGKDGQLMFAIAKA